MKPFCSAGAKAATVTAASATAIHAAARPRDESRPGTEARSTSSSRAGARGRVGPLDHVPPSERKSQAPGTVRKCPEQAERADRAEQRSAPERIHVAERFIVNLPHEAAHGSS